MDKKLVPKTISTANSLGFRVGNVKVITTSSLTLIFLRELVMKSNNVVQTGILAVSYCRIYDYKNSY